MPTRNGVRKRGNEEKRGQERYSLLKAMQRSRPDGSEKWVGRTVAKFGLENTLRSPGRPKGQINAPDPIPSTQPFSNSNEQ